MLIHKKNIIDRKIVDVLYETREGYEPLVRLVLSDGRELFASVRVYEDGDVPEATIEETE